MRYLPIWCVYCCHVPSTSDSTLCLMLWLQWILRNFSELFLEAGNMILFNYKLNVISPNDSVRDPPFAETFRGNRFFPREWQTSILFKNMPFWSALKVFLIAYQIKNKCLRLIFTSFLKKGPTSLYSFIICSFLYVPFLLTNGIANHGSCH